MLLWTSTSDYHMWTFSAYINVHLLSRSTQDYTILDCKYVSVNAHCTQKYNNLYMPSATKIYLLLWHAIQFIASKPHELSVYGERAFEGVHHDFTEHFKLFKREPDYPQFVENLEGAVATYNARYFVN